VAPSIQRARGFTLIELVVVVIAVSIMIGLALDRLLPLIGRAQRAAFLQVRAELQTALILEAADRITRGESATLPELAGGNPMRWLLRAPANYLGSLRRPEADSLPRAIWYFDEHASALVYRVGSYARFEPLDGPSDRIELKVAFVYTDRDANGSFDAAVDRFDGLSLEPVHAYAWPD
jgi:prepilin-type N-terminal cleavage/methylation domain-containing protein